MLQSSPRIKLFGGTKATSINLVIPVRAAILLSTVFLFEIDKEHKVHRVAQRNTEISPRTYTKLTRSEGVKIHKSISK